MMINKKAVRSYALEYAGANRAWKPTRVSRGFLEYLEGRIKETIENQVHQHPARGKTLMSPMGD